MKADFKIGVCVSTQDPRNLGRIRAVPLDYFGREALLTEITSFIEKQDAQNIAASVYNPWFSTVNGNFREKDRFLCEPFLPKNLVVQPNPGQLVKIIVYDDLNQVNEFIGPYTIDQISLTEEYRNVIKSLIKSDFTLDQVVPKKNKIFISGYNNEQIIMGENEILMRLNYFNPANKTRKNSYPFIQLSQFTNSYNIKENTVTRPVDVDPIIDHIFQLSMEYYIKNSVTDKNFTATLVLFESKNILNSQNKLGLTLTTYSPKTQYTTPITNNYVVKYVITSDKLEKISSIIQGILESFDKDKILKYFDINNLNNTQIFQNDTANIMVYNNIPAQPNAGGALEQSNILPKLKNWLFRLDPTIKIENFQEPFSPFEEPNLPDQNINKIRYFDFINLKTFIEETFAKEIKYGSLNLNNQETITETINQPEPTNKSQSVYTAYSDKFLFLSQLNSLNVIDDFTSDGIRSEKISEFLSGKNINVKTYGSIRGEKLVDILIEMIDLFLKHGHSDMVDKSSSVIENSRNQANDIKRKLLNEKEQNQNSVIINHNFRLD